MPLTSHLGEKDSPVRQFMETEFPHVSQYVDAHRIRVQRSYTIRPRGAPPWNIIGRAVDYRIRYYFAITPWDEFIAYDGQRRITDHGSRITDHGNGECEIDNSALAYPQYLYRVRKDKFPPGRHSVYWYEKQTCSRVAIADNGVFSYDSTSLEYFGEDLDEMQAMSERILGIEMSKERRSRPQSATDFASQGLQIPDIFEVAQSGDTGQFQPARDNPILHSPYGEFFTSLGETVNRLQPVKSRLDEAGEDELNRCSIILGLLETAYRVGEQDDIIKSADPKKLSDLFAIVKQNWTEDMRNLSWKFYDRYSRLLSFPANLNPQFEYSRVVGGADADLIVNGMLIDIKATLNPRLEKEWVWQLLGYALLDRFDRHEIQYVGLYMARQGLLVWWSLDELVKGVSGKNWSIKELRELFFEKALLEIERRESERDERFQEQLRSVKRSRKKRRGRK